MKKVKFFSLFLVLVLTLINCTKMPELTPEDTENEKDPIESTTGIRVKSAQMVGDTAVLKVNEVYIFQMMEDDAIISATFIFGDGSTEKGLAVTHKYSEIGIYTINGVINSTSEIKSLIVKVVSDEVVITPDNEIIIIQSKTIAVDGKSADFKFLFRADAISGNGTNPANSIMFWYKTTNTYWKDAGYVLTDKVTVNKVNYYAYSIKLAKNEIISFIYSNSDQSKWSSYEPSNSHLNDEGLYSYQINSDWELTSIGEVSEVGVVGDDFIRIGFGLNDVMLFYVKKTEFSNNKPYLIYQGKDIDETYAFQTSLDNSDYYIASVSNISSEAKLWPKDVELSNMKSSIFFSEKDSSLHVNIVTMKSANASGHNVVMQSLRTR